MLHVALDLGFRYLRYFLYFVAFLSFSDLRQKFEKLSLKEVNLFS
jgi:hypothetical protein